MAKKVSVEIDIVRSSLRAIEGRLFLGTLAKVELVDWSPDTTDYTPVLTIFAPNTVKPLARTTYTDGELMLDLRSAELRKAFHGETASHQFTAYLNQIDPDGKWKPEVEAVGNILIEWSPEVFDTDTGTVATMVGPAGSAGADGKSAYQLAVENGYVGTVTQWLQSIKGEPGNDGADGRDGTNGRDGRDGIDGINGTNGTNGTDGTDGADGKSA